MNEQEYAYLGRLVMAMAEAERQGNRMALGPDGAA
jgi:hypothetical protein